MILIFLKLALQTEHFLQKKKTTRKQKKQTPPQIKRVLILLELYSTVFVWKKLELTL